MSVSGRTGSVAAATPRRLPPFSRLRPQAERVRLLAGAHPVVSLALFGALCAAVAWFRLPAVARDTLWAEDGRNFLQAAADHGLADTVLTPYAGYLHVIPRIIAGVVVTLPIAWWALAMTAASCLVAGAVAVVVFVCARDVVPWLPARILVASLTVLAPLAPREVLGNTANLHSLLLWAMLWMLLYRPRTRLGAVVLGSVGLLAGLTEIQGALLVPLLLCAPHGRRRWIVRGGILLGLAAQLFVTVLWPRPLRGIRRSRRCRSHTATSSTSSCRSSCRRRRSDPFSPGPGRPSPSRFCSLSRHPSSSRSPAAHVCSGWRSPLSSPVRLSSSPWTS